MSVLLRAVRQHGMGLRGPRRLTVGQRRDSRDRAHAARPACPARRATGAIRRGRSRASEACRRAAPRACTRLGENDQPRFNRPFTSAYNGGRGYIHVARPSDLPDFRNPPLNEVVIGVQFQPPRGYSQILAGQVWELFRSEFPHVEEQPPLPPTFETFGRQQPLQFGVGISIGGTSHDRFWFLSRGKEELIQFQQDRLLHNWRKVGDETQYPRFERMISKFENELGGLEDYFATLSPQPQPLVINQCEISYINHIPLDQEGPRAAGRWLRVLNFDGVDLEDFNAVFRRAIRDGQGKPCGRLTCEAVSAFAAGKLVIRLSLTARGAPARTDIPAALEFLQRGREMVVRAFTDITTELAHQAWDRLQ